MKNELKRACTFYLGSWWLPAVLIFILSCLMPTLTSESCFIAPDGTKTYIHKAIIPQPYMEWLTCSLLLGLLANWIWLLFHKRWLKFAINIGFVMILIILYFGFVKFINPYVQIPLSNKNWWKNFDSVIEHRMTEIESSQAETTDAISPTHDEP